MLITRILKSIRKFLHDAIRMLLYFFFPSIMPPKPPPQDRIDIDM